MLSRLASRQWRAPRSMLGARRAFALEPVSQHVLNAADWELAYAAQLRTAFFEGKLLEADAFPAELRNTSGPLLAAADRIQHLALTGMRMQRVGYKIGATNVAAQTGLTLTTPFLGPVLAESLFDSPASVTATGRHVRGVEAEFGFEMKNTLMPRGPNGTPYTELDVAAAIRKMIPCIEVVGTRFSPAASAALPPIALLSDFGGAHAVVKGNRHFKNWADVALDQTAVTMRVNGEVRASGRGADVLGHPVRALTWLVNYLSARNIALHKDAFVITGTCTGLTPVKAGDKVTAEFDGLGEVEVHLA